MGISPFFLSEAIFKLFEGRNHHYKVRAKASLQHLEKIDQRNFKRRYFESVISSIIFIFHFSINRSKEALEVHMDL